MERTTGHEPLRQAPTEDIMPPPWMIFLCLMLAFAAAFFVAAIDPLAALTLVVTLTAMGLTLKIVLKHLPR
jgi:hypothetical protein